MKELDQQKAIRFIEKFKAQIKEVSAGLHEDWFWTAATVFDSENPESINFDLAYTSSTWATPALNVTTIDGNDFFISCYVGESTREKDSIFALGVLSGPCQDRVNQQGILHWNESENAIPSLQP